MNKNSVQLDINKITDKIMFIYKALEDGWTVTKINNNTYEFNKRFDDTRLPINNIIENFIEKTKADK